MTLIFAKKNLDKKKPLIQWLFFIVKYKKVSLAK